jgi:hypothetical protein
MALQILFRTIGIKQSNIQQLIVGYLMHMSFALFFLVLLLKTLNSQHSDEWVSFSWVSFIDVH